jgi:hypothetical protein
MSTARRQVNPSPRSDKTSPRLAHARSGSQLRVDGAIRFEERVDVFGHVDRGTVSIAS